MPSMTVTREQYMDLIEKSIAGAEQIHQGGLPGRAKAVLRAHALAAKAVARGSFRGDEGEFGEGCPATQVGLYLAQGTEAALLDPSALDFAIAFDRASLDLWKTDQGIDLPAEPPRRLVIA